MSNRKFTNGDVMQHDWTQCHRASLLRTLHADHMPRIPAVSKGWGTDVTGDDPRSIRADLAGKGGLRTAWWSLYSAVYVTVDQSRRSSARYTRSITAPRAYLV